MRVICWFLLLISFSVQAAAQERSGEDVYKTACATCHSLAIANAPKTHDKQAWQARGKGINELLESAKKGLNAMPPNGACMNCTDAELKAAIEFMMNESKQ